MQLQLHCNALQDPALAAPAIAAIWGFSRAPAWPGNVWAPQLGLRGSLGTARDGNRAHGAIEDPATAGRKRRENACGR
eukprot:scaffold1277_cov253-Pinguiococcus_pyrenoidosus.AAC.5